MKKRGAYKRREEKIEFDKPEEIQAEPEYTGDEPVEAEEARPIEVSMEQVNSAQSDRITPDQITDADIKAIELILGRTRSSWHMIDQREIIAACLNHSFVIELK
jgi:hypothetical protein